MHTLTLQYHTTVGLITVSCLLLICDFCSSLLAKNLKNNLKKSFFFVYVDEAFFFFMFFKDPQRSWSTGSPNKYTVEEIIS